MPERLRFGVLGAAYIADRALIPAMHAASNAEPVAIASREPARAAQTAARHGLATVHASYDALLEDPGVDAVYVALHNSAHLEWTIRALRAGKHVLCEKPLGMNAAEVRQMTAVAAESGRSLMEAFMYRFHPRMQALQADVEAPVYLSATCAFTLAAGPNYRWLAPLGGGALLDVGCYTLDVVRWLAGEPTTVHAVLHQAGVDRSVACALAFESGALATTWASFEAPEQQELIIVDAHGRRHLEQPFTAWRDPHDPYQLMVEAFATSVLNGEAAPRSLEDSLGTAVLLDRVRAAAQPFSGSAAPSAR